MGKLIILTWNPSNWYWDKYKLFIDKYLDLPFNESWACRIRNINIEDEFILLLQGKSYKFRGIIGAGKIVSLPYKKEHWDKEKANLGITQTFINISFNKLIDLTMQKPLTTEYLINKYPQQHWIPQGSGISILPKYKDEILNEFYNYNEEGNSLIDKDVKEITKRKSKYLKLKSKKTAEKKIELDFDEYI